MKKSFDTIVLGLGGIGSATAYHLAKAGQKVLGIEQFAPVHSLGSSHGESRIIRKAYFEHPNYVPLLLSAYEAWSELERETKSKLYHETGLAYFGKESSDLLKGVQKSSSLYSIPLRNYSHSEIKIKFPQFQIPNYMMAIEEPEAGFLLVEECIRKHLESSEKLGAELHFHEPVEKWESVGPKICVTTQKAKYEATHLILSPGAWALDLLNGLKLKLTTQRKTVFWYEADQKFESLEKFPCFLIHDEKDCFYGIPKISKKGVKLGDHSRDGEPTDPKSIDRKVYASDEAPILNFKKHYLPALTGQKTSESVCMYTKSLNDDFVIDQHPDFPNVYFAVGFSGHGFKFCSVMGQILKDLVLEKKTLHPIDFLRLRQEHLER